MEKLMKDCGYNEVRTHKLSLGIASLYIARVG